MDTWDEKHIKELRKAKPTQRIFLLQNKLDEEEVSNLFAKYSSFIGQAKTREEASANIQRQISDSFSPSFALFGLLYLVDEARDFIQSFVAKTLKYLKNPINQKQNTVLLYMTLLLSYYGTNSIPIKFFASLLTDNEEDIKTGNFWESQYELSVLFKVKGISFLVIHKIVAEEIMKFLLVPTGGDTKAPKSHLADTILGYFSTLENSKEDITDLVQIMEVIFLNNNEFVSILANSFNSLA